MCSIQSSSPCWPVQGLREDGRQFLTWSWPDLLRRVGSDPLVLQRAWYAPRQGWGWPSPQWTALVLVGKPPKGGLREEWPQDGWLLRDDAGDVITPKQFDTAWLERRRTLLQSRKPQPAFRAAPVPYTGVRHRGGMLRAPSCKGMLRERALAATGVEFEESDAPIGRCRHLRAYPVLTTYDDEYRHVERNWKRQRAAQWRAV